MKYLAIATIFLTTLVGQPAFAAQTKSEKLQANQLSADQLFGGDRIVEIEIELAKADWDSARMQSRSFTEALGKSPAVSPFEYVKANLTIDGKLIPNVGLRKKGFLGSLDDHRPSLKINFSKFEKQDPIQGLDRLTLNNNKQDPACISQYLTFKLFNESGTIAPRCGFAKVTVNGEYLGIYSNVESVGPQFLERGFGDGSGDCFEGTVAEFHPDWVKKFEKKNKGATYKNLDQIAKLMEAEEIDLVELEKNLDLEAFIKYWAMESTLGFWDSYCSNQNNFFVYQNPTNSKFYFIPWGTDCSFSETMPLPPYVMRPRAVHAKSILPNRLYRIPKIQKLYLETLTSILDNQWNEAELLQEIDRLEALLEEDAKEINEGFKRTISKYRSFIKSRRADLVAELKNGPPELTSGPKMPAYFANIGKATISFSTQWFEVTPDPKDVLGNVEIELELDGEKVQLEDVGIYAEASKWPSPDKIKPPSIVIFGTRKSDGTVLTLGTGLPIEHFKPTTADAVAMSGIVLIDSNFMPGGKMQMIGGTVSFEKASMVEGEPIKGKMNLTIMQMRGGKEFDGEN